MQAIKGQTEACYQDTMPYSYEEQLGILYMHYHIDMIINGIGFGKPVCTD